MEEAPALSDRLVPIPGDTFKLGRQGQFRLSALMRPRTRQRASGFALGPRTLLAHRSLEGAGLLAEGDAVQL